MRNKEMFSSTKTGDQWTRPYRVALHRAAHTGEWVTHIQNADDNSFNGGNYFGDDYAAALASYRARCDSHAVLSFCCRYCGDNEHTGESCRVRALRPV